MTQGDYSAQLRAKLDGLVEIGHNCTIGAGSGMGVIRVGNNVRTLPGTTLSPYLLKVKDGAVVGWNPPKVHNEEGEKAAQS